MADIDAATTFPNGIALGDDDNVGIFQGSADPTGGAGEVAPIGSLYLRDNGELYQKTSAPATGWSLFSGGGGGSNDNVAITSNDTTPDYLLNKITSNRTALTFAEINDGGDEDLRIDIADLIGDSGSGGTAGLTPAPSAGDAALGYVLRADGTWGPIPGEGLPASTDNNAVFAYDTTTQVINPANAWQEVTFNTNVVLEDWTHTAGTSIFTCAKTDRYLVTIDLGYQRAGGGNQFAVRATFNGTLVPGSQMGQSIQANNTPFKTARTFVIDAVASQNLIIQVAADTINVSVQPGPDPVGGGSPVSASITIRR